MNRTWTHGKELKKYLKKDEKKLDEAGGNIYYYT